LIKKILVIDKIATRENVGSCIDVKVKAKRGKETDKNKRRNEK
jgi:hypothetical protein